MMDDWPELTIVAAEQSDSPHLLNIKPGFGENEIRDRFRWLEQQVDGTWFLLKQGHDLIGWCVATWSGKRTHPEYPDMQDLFIREEYRNGGCGTFLITEIERIAKDRGYGMIGLAVNQDHNLSARRLYERLGYGHDGGEKYLDGVYGEFEDWVIDLEKRI